MSFNNKKILLLIILLISLGSIASALPPVEDYNLFYFVNTTTNITTSDGSDCGDYSSFCNKVDNSTNNATAKGGVTINSDGYFDFDGSSDYLDLGAAAMPSSLTALTVCSWVREDVAGSNDKLYGNTWKTNYWQYYMSSVSGKPRFLVGECDGALDYTFIQTDTWTIPSTGLTFLCGVWAGGNDFKIYINGNSTTESTTIYPTGSLSSGDSSGCTGATHKISAIENTPADFFDGKQQGISYFDRALSGSEISDLYDEGAQYDPFTNPLLTLINDSVENTAVVKQVGTVTISAASYQTVFSSSFNNSVNNSQIYGSYSFNVESTATNELTCQLLIDSVVKGEVVRTNTAGLLGSVYLQSNLFNLTEGAHTQELQCRKSSGAAAFTISNAIGIGHFMYDETEEEVPHTELNISGSVSSGSSYTLINETNFTISNRTTGGTNNVTKMLVLEWMSNYQNNAASTEQLQTYISINDTNCSIYPRDVSSGGTGSVSGDCLLENVNTNSTYNIKFYGNGSNAVYSGNLVIKEFIMSDEEIAGGSGALVGFNFSGASDTMLFNLSGGNLNHGLSNVFQKQAYSIRTNQSTTVTMYVKMINGTNWTTVNMTRDFAANEIGVLIGQDIFEDVPQDTYELQVWANCGGAFCEIVGGAGIGYLTDVTTTIINSVNISAVDSFNGSSITNFNVTTESGAIFQSNNGFVIVSSSDELNNLTVSATDYFDYEFTNLNFTLNTSVTAYMDLIQARLNMTANFRTIANATITSITLEAISLNGSENFNISTTDGDFLILLDRLESYNFTFKPDGYEWVNFVYNATNDTSQIYTKLYYLYTLNSIRVSILDELTRTNITGFTFDLEFISDAVSFNTSTSNGSLFVDLLSPSEYEIRYSSSTNSTIWSPRSYFFTVVNGSSSSISLYAINTSLTTVANKLVFIKDKSDNVLEDATFFLQRQYILSDNTSQFITVEMGATDSEGKADYYAQENSNVKYRFLAVVDGVTLFTSEATNLFGEIDDEQTFRVSTGTQVQAIEDFFGIAGTVIGNDTTNIFSASYVDTRNSISGAVFEVTFYNSTTKETNTVHTASLSLTSGTFSYTASNTTGGTYEANLYIIDAFGNRISISGDSLFYELPTAQFTPNEMFFMLMMADILSLLVFVFNPLVGVISTFLLNSSLVFLFAGSKAMIGINMGLMVIALIGIWVVRNKVNN